MPEHKQSKQTQQKKPFYRKKPFLWTVGSVLGVIVLVLIAFRVSPWPGAMVIRYVFSKNDVKTTEALEKHAPTTPITIISDQKYRAHDGDALLDVYFPESKNCRSLSGPTAVPGYPEGRPITRPTTSSLHHKTTRLSR